MRPLRYSINVTLDGCCDHMAGIPDEETHRHAMESIARADALLFNVKAECFPCVLPGVQTLRALLEFIFRSFLAHWNFPSYLNSMPCRIAPANQRRMLSS